MNIKRETRLKLWILAFTVCVLIPLIIGAGYVKRSVDAARARSEFSERLVASFKAIQPVVLTAAAEQATLEESTPEAIAQRVYVRQQKCLAHMIDGEAGDQGLEGMRAVAYVGYGRSLDNLVEWGGTNLCDVVCKHTPERWQFDGAKAACLRNMTGQPSALAMEVAYKVIVGEYKADGCLPRARYFMNPVTSGNNGALWMLRKSKFCMTIGEHIFAEPRPIRNKMIAKAQHQRSHKKHPPVEVASKHKAKLQRVAHR